MSEKKKRDRSLDALRGLLLVVMTMDHFRTAFFNFTYESLGYITAAEGFVFLSGFIAGRVYIRYGQTESRKSLWKRVLLRAGFIYTCHIIVFISLFIAAVLGLKTWYLQIWASQFYERPLVALLMGLTLTYQPRLLDILPMYCIFILCVPFVVRAGRGAFMIVLISGAIWLTTQFGITEAVVTVISKHFPLTLGSFDLFSWQFLFITGVFFGSRQFQKKCYKLKKYLLIPFAALAIVLFLARHGLIKNANFLIKIESMAQIGTLGPVRLINFFLVAFLIGQVVVWPINNGIAGALALLGRHSIEVFAFHIFLIYLFFGVFGDSSLKELWLLLIISSLFLPAWYFEKFKNPFKRLFSVRIVSAPIHAATNGMQGVPISSPNQTPGEINRPPIP